MRSVKSELYIWLKTMVIGGSYTDQCDVVHTYPGILENVTAQKVKKFAFWNSEIIGEVKDSFPTPAVFFEYSNSGFNSMQLGITDYNDFQQTKDDVEFTLHIIGSKTNAENKDSNYLNLIDLGDDIFRLINNKSLLGIKNITRIREIQDINSSVLMDWTQVYSVKLTNEGRSDLINVQDISNNPESPIPFDIQVNY